MKKRHLAFVVGMVVLLATFPALSATMRYAIVIGNNIGVDANGTQPFPPLIHAEREAKRLTEQLVKVANFDRSSKRTKLLLNADRASVIAAFEALARQQEKDAKLIADFESIFLFYFTGHGVAGKLLMSDGALDAHRITELFNRIGADFSVGVFDACYAGSLDELLKKKGIRPTHGLNLASKMPEQILSAKGSIWFVSSGANESSFEDRDKGGIFTHFFIEALNSAKREGPAITLEQIWNYARRKTISYTMKHNKRQTPEQFVSKLRARAPIYFSFPTRQNATLVLSPKLQGTFALSYAEGHLVKIIEKRAGKKQEVIVFPGEAQLFIFGGRETERRLLRLKENEALYIHSFPETPPAAEKGQQSENLFPKGIGMDDNITITAIRPGASLIFGAGYEGSFTHWKMLHPRHRVYIPVRADWKRVYLGVRLVYGYDHREHHMDTPYVAQMAAGGLFGGTRLRFRSYELNIGADLTVGYIWQRFEKSDADADEVLALTGQSVQFTDSYIGKKWEAHVKSVAGIQFPRKGRWFVEVAGHVGFIVGPGTAVDSSHKANLTGGLSLAVYFRGV